MQNRRTFATLATVIILAAPVTAAAQAPALTWGPAPAVFPAGARMAVLQGDPGKAELFTVRLQMPAGYTIPPHWHPTDEHVTVISGALKLGMGEKIDQSHATRLPAGGFVTAGAKMNHWAQATGKTVVQVHAMGPFQLTYVNPKDTPVVKAGQ